MMLDSLMEYVAKAPPRATRRVLIVEDNGLNRKLFGAMLAAEGYEVHEAADGPSGLGIAREQHPDVIVMDVNLPGMSGLEVARNLKAEDGTRDISIIVTTAYCRETDAEIVAAGCDGFMAKPIGVSEFLETIAASFEHRAGASAQPE